MSSISFFTTLYFFPSSRYPVVFPSESVTFGSNATIFLDGALTLPTSSPVSTSYTSNSNSPS